MCVVCFPPVVPQGLLWLGQAYYTPDQWLLEANQLGISRKIPAVPKGFVVGEHWVYMAARMKYPEGEPPVHFIFAAWRPVRIEVIVTRPVSENPKRMAQLQARGLTPVVVPGDDADHNPKGYSSYQLGLALDAKLGTL